MGNQVTVSFLTDHWNEVRKNPEQLVEAIDCAMNYGNESMSRTAYNRLRENPPRPDNWPLSEYHDIDMFLRRNYVTVHQYHHADETRVYFTHGNSSWDVVDFQWSVRKGFLETVSNPRTYVNIGRDLARSLRDEAKYLDETLDAWEKDHPEES